jgi:hypothetical protein
MAMKGTKPHLILTFTSLELLLKERLRLHNLFCTGDRRVRSPPMHWKRSVKTSEKPDKMVVSGVPGVGDTVAEREQNAATAVKKMVRDALGDSKNSAKCAGHFFEDNVGARLSKRNSNKPVFDVFVTVYGFTNASTVVNALHRRDYEGHQLSVFAPGKLAICKKCRGRGHQFEKCPVKAALRIDGHGEIGLNVIQLLEARCSPTSVVYGTAPPGIKPKSFATMFFDSKEAAHDPMVMKQLFMLIRGGILSRVPIFTPGSILPGCSACGLLDLDTPTGGYQHHVSGDACCPLNSDSRAKTDRAPKTFDTSHPHARRVRWVAGPSGSHYWQPLPGRAGARGEASRSDFKPADPSTGTSHLGTDPGTPRRVTGFSGPR